MISYKKMPELILLNSGIAKHNADWNWMNVSSPFARIHLVRRGRAYITVDDKKYLLEPGKLYLTPPFTLHSNECTEEFELYYLHVFENPQSKSHVFDDYNFPFEVDASELDYTLVENLLRLNPSYQLPIYDPKDYDTPLFLERNVEKRVEEQMHTVVATRGILLYLLSHFFERASLKHEIIDTRVKGMLKYIRKNIDKNIDVSELSAVSVVSTNHTIRLFKSELGVTPIDYINQKKIEKAQLMLISGNKSVKRIAYDLAFDNISYFNRLFKRYTGTTPKNYVKGETIKNCSCSPLDLCEKCVAYSALTGTKH